jgi:hypothetical protein
MLIYILLTNIILYDSRPLTWSLHPGYPRTCTCITVSAEITTKSTPFIACRISRNKNDRNSVFLVSPHTTRQLRRIESLYRL